MRVGRFAATVYLVGLGIGSLVLVPAYDAWSASSQEGRHAIEIDGARVALTATDARLDSLLEDLALYRQFEVRSRLSEAALPRVTGRKAGTLAEVLEWLLRYQNYVIVRGVDLYDNSRTDASALWVILSRPPGTPSPDPGRSDMAGNGVRPPSADRSMGRERRDAAPLMPLETLDFSQIRQHDPEREADSARRLATAANPVELTASGTELPDVTVDPSRADLMRTIDLAGDLPTATYVLALRTANGSLQQGERGQWLPWDGQETSLLDTELEPSDGKLNFNIAAGDISDELFPVTYMVAYRTADALKFGVFQVMPE